MSKEIYISSTPHETRLAIVEDEGLAEIYYERENEYTLAGSIYNGKVTRVLPGMQSSFVDIGLERDAFLYITDFMEEAGDSADFDGGDGARRPEGRRQAGPQTIQGERGGEARSGETRSTEQSGGESGQRTERSGGRGRGGRGRWDRGGNRDRQQQPGDAGVPQEQDEFERPIEFVAEGEAVEPVETGEIGEGAPGADGSRRWRGRRGRRRGRGQREGAPQTGTQGSDSSELSGHQDGVAVGSEAPIEYSEAGDEFYGGDDFDLEATEGSVEPVAVEPISAATSVRPEASAAVEESRGRGERGGRGDRDRGRGGRSGRGRDERGRDDRGQRDQRGPRGFAPRTSAYGIEDGPAYGDAANDVPAGEPIILPGESLSKYRQGGEEPAAAASAKASAEVITPSVPSYVIPEGWDGGSVLPGETLSRRRGGESGRESRRESGRESGRERNREPRAEVRESSQVAYRQEVVPVAPVVAESIVTEQIVAEPVAVQPEVHAVVPAEPVEYEPTEAAASYRVDPIAPSEFRQAAPVIDEPTEEGSAIVAAVVESTPEPVAEHVESNAVHSITPAPGESIAPLHSAVEKSAAFEPFDWQTPAVEEPAPLPHQLTTLHATGEMHSETPEATFAPAPESRPFSPAEPIEHEAAVADPAENRVEASAMPLVFAPGEGVLEEEMLDEEDYTLHASSYEDTEEETLEGAADLGTMLDDMAIDQITRVDPVDEDEDDFEEEDAVYDPSSVEFSGDDEDLDEADTEEDVIHEDFSGEGEFTPEGDAEVRTDAPAEDRGADRDRERGRGRRDGRRDGRRGFVRGGDRMRHTGGAGDRERMTTGGGGRDRRGGRNSMQSTNLPAINELLKPGQEILVQIAKEPIAKKGARITSHIALPGRFLVFMPTVNHTGVSRKIESDGERRRLKEILLSEKGDAAGGFIVRTAASGASEEELRSDLRFLLNLWADIKQRSESSKSPALIYHDLNLVERILRDQVTDNFSAIWVDSESEYERVLRFLQRFQPSLIRRVKLYTKETPLFEQFGITEEINKALRSKVWLKSGGSIVINQTEALVAIDINTGKFVGKTARLEDTIVKTNLDAIPEIVRQIRLRDLGGIIIIDFIDMDERKNRNRVMAALEEELKNDRAPSKVLQFNDFGLVAITRKRVKQSLERTLSTTCEICTGTGMVKSPVTVCNDIYIEMRKMQKHLDRGDVMLRVNPEVVKQLKSPGTKWLQEMEDMVGKTILVKSDPSLHPEQFDIH